MHALTTKTDNRPSGGVYAIVLSVWVLAVMLSSHVAVRRSARTHVKRRDVWDVFEGMVDWLTAAAEGGWLAVTRVKARFPIIDPPIVVKNQADELFWTVVSAPRVMTFPVLMIFAQISEWFEVQELGGWLDNKKVKSRFPYGRPPVRVNNWKDETLLSVLSTPFHVAAASAWVCLVGWRWWEAGPYGGWLVTHTTPVPAYPMSMIKAIHTLFPEDREASNAVTN